MAAGWLPSHIKSNDSIHPPPSAPSSSSSCSEKQLLQIRASSAQLAFCHAVFSCDLLGVNQLERQDYTGPGYVVSLSSHLELSSQS